MATTGEATIQRSEELVDLLTRFYQAAQSGDTAFLEHFISAQEGVLCIGTDPQEWWQGAGTIGRVFKAQVEEMGGSFPLEPGSPEGYREGSVGWVADRPKLKLPDGTEMEFRLTMVCHQEAGEWKLVQAHFSIGVPNEEAVGKGLTV